MSEDAAGSTQQVFINCPFDAEFSSVFEALVFSVRFCGFTPRCAREFENGVRLGKLFGIIRQCRYGIHDLSRSGLDPVTGLARFNMPLELGIFLGACEFGDDGQREKCALILDIDSLRYMGSISDLRGMDPVAHGADPAIAVEAVRNWLKNVSRRKMASPRDVVAAYRKFAADKVLICQRLGFDPSNTPYADFDEMVINWLLEAA